MRQEWVRDSHLARAGLCRCQNAALGMSTIRKATHSITSTVSEAACARPTPECGAVTGQQPRADHIHSHRNQQLCRTSSGSTGINRELGRPGVQARKTANVEQLLTTRDYTKSLCRLVVAPTTQRCARTHTCAYNRANRTDLGIEKDLRCCMVPRAPTPQLESNDGHKRRQTLHFL